MSLEDFNAQSALWDTLPVKSDILIIDRQLAQVPGVRASIISELDELLKVPREQVFQETVGIVFAHKRLQKPESQDEDEDEQEPLDPMFLPYFGANPSPAWSQSAQYGSSDSDPESSDREDSDAEDETQECCTDIPDAQGVSGTEEAKKTKPEKRGKNSKKHGSKSTKEKGTKGKKSRAPVKQKDNDHDQDTDSGRPCRRNLRSHKRR